MKYRSRTSVDCYIYLQDKLCISCDTVRTGIHFPVEEMFCISACARVCALYVRPLGINAAKIFNLQELKAEILDKYHGFCDNLLHDE